MTRQRWGHPRAPTGGVRLRHHPGLQGPQKALSQERGRVTPAPPKVQLMTIRRSDDGADGEKEEEGG